MFYFEVNFFRFGQRLRDVDSLELLGLEAVVVVGINDSVASLIGEHLIAHVLFLIVLSNLDVFKLFFNVFQSLNQNLSFRTFISFVSCFSTLNWRTNSVSEHLFSYSIVEIYSLVNWRSISFNIGILLSLPVMMSPSLWSILYSTIRRRQHCLVCRLINEKVIRTLFELCHSSLVCFSWILFLCFSTFFILQKFNR